VDVIRSDLSAANSLTYITTNHVQVSDKYNKLDAEDIYDKMFRDAEKATSNLELVSFQPFRDTADAVSAITACQEGKVGASLETFLSKKLKKILKKSNGGSTLLAVADKALAVSLKQEDVLSQIKVVHDDKTAELYRGIRLYMEELLSSGADGDGGVTAGDLHKMQLGLSHSLGRYKLKFSADKVDTMVIQAVGLLDELDKEINTYAMRVKVSGKLLDCVMSCALRLFCCRLLTTPTINVRCRNGTVGTFLNFRLSVPTMRVTRNSY